jgi:hypothetical protein
VLIICWSEVQDTALRLSQKTPEADAGGKQGS